MSDAPIDPKRMGQQLDIFHVLQAYQRDEVLTNDQLYQAVGEAAGIPEGQLNTKNPIGKAGALRSTLKRKIRWHQQTLKSMGVLERVEGDLVIDPFAGSNKVGLAAQRNNRRWLAREKVLEYLRVQAEMFHQFTGFQMNPGLIR